MLVLLVPFAFGGICLSCSSTILSDRKNVILVLALRKILKNILCVVWLLGVLVLLGVLDVCIRVIVETEVTVRSVRSFPSWSFEYDVAALLLLVLVVLALVLVLVLVVWKCSSKWSSMCDDTGGKLTVKLSNSTSTRWTTTRLVRMVMSVIQVFGGLISRLRCVTVTDSGLIDAGFDWCNFIASINETLRWFEIRFLIPSYQYQWHRTVYSRLHKFEILSLAAFYGLLCIGWFCLSHIPLASRGERDCSNYHLSLEYLASESTLESRELAPHYAIPRAILEFSETPPSSHFWHSNLSFAFAKEANTNQQLW